MGLQAGSSFPWAAQIEEPDSIFGGCQEELMLLAGAVQKLQRLSIAITVEPGMNLQTAQEFMLVSHFVAGRSLWLADVESRHRQSNKATGFEGMLKARTYALQHLEVCNSNPPRGVYDHIVLYLLLKHANRQHTFSCITM